MEQLQEIIPFVGFYNQTISKNYNNWVTYLEFGVLELAAAWVSLPYFHGKTNSHYTC